MRIQCRTKQTHNLRRPRFLLALAKCVIINILTVNSRAIPELTNIEKKTGFFLLVRSALNVPNDF